MRSRTLLWLIVVLLVELATSSAAGDEPPAPGGINLLPGYHHYLGQGIDSKIGRIWKERGLTIHYDIGELAGDYTECGHSCGWTEGEVWRREQILQGQRIICVFTKRRRLVISFPQVHANFYGTVRTDMELTDMLLMVFTFRPAG